MKGELSKLWLALSVSYFSLLLQFYEMFTASNRYAMRWRMVYLWESIAAICILAVVYYICYRLLAKIYDLLPRLHRPLIILMVAVMWFILLRSILSMLLVLPVLPDSVTGHAVVSGVKVALYGCVAFLVLLFTCRMKQIVCAVYYVLSPVLVLLVTMGISYPEWDPLDKDSFDALLQTHEQQSEAIGDVIILVFDEWSYERTFAPDGTAKLVLPNIKCLRSDATFYTRAFSPGDDTVAALPRFVYQMNHELLELEESQLTQMLFARSFALTNSIFSLAAPGQKRIACGIYHDYAGMLDGETDYAARIDDPHIPFWKAVKRMLGTQLAWIRFLGIDLAPVLSEGWMDLNWAERVEEMHGMLLAAVTQTNTPVFALFHYAIPHQPFVWGADGKVVNPPWNPQEHTAEAYLSNIEGVDYFLGQLLRELMQARRYEDAMIVVTSDHSWRTDPALSGIELSDGVCAMTERRHVPLIVKRPSQKHAETVTEKTCLVELHKMLD